MYAGVLVRMEEFLPIGRPAPSHGEVETKDSKEEEKAGEEKKPESFFKDPDYDSIRKVFVTIMGPLFTKRGEDQFESFDRLVEANFKELSFDYNSAQGSITLDSLVTEASPDFNPSRVSMKPIIETDSAKWTQTFVLKNLRRSTPVLLVGGSGGGKT